MLQIIINLLLRSEIVDVLEDIGTGSGIPHEEIVVGIAVFAVQFVVVLDVEDTIVEQTIDLPLVGYVIEDINDVAVVEDAGVKSLIDIGIAVAINIVGLPFQGVVTVQTRADLKLHILAGGECKQGENKG